jgi:hypothetical protein
MKSVVLKGDGVVALALREIALGVMRRGFVHGIAVQRIAELFAASGVHFIDQTHAIAALVRVVSVAIGVGFVLRGTLCSGRCGRRMRTRTSISRGVRSRRIPRRRTCGASRSSISRESRSAQKRR